MSGTTPKAVSTSIDTIQPEASSAPPRSPEASVYPDLAAIVTAAVMGMMFYFGPWADPPGMDELWWLLTTAAVMLASWRWWARRRAT